MLYFITEISLQLCYSHFRMSYLERISIFHFKSYTQQQEFHFSDKLNCIVGRNGCGKSALVDAICCTLGFNVKHLRVSKYSELITHQMEKCNVELQFCGCKNVVISFSVDSAGPVTFRYNGKQLSRERLRQTIGEQLGLTSPIFVIQQNRIQSFYDNLVDFLHEVIQHIRVICRRTAVINISTSFVTMRKRGLYCVVSCRKSTKQSHTDSK